MYVINAAIILGVIIAWIDTRKNKVGKGARVKGLVDNEIPCREAFKNLEIVNSWGDDPDDK